MTVPSSSSSSSAAALSSPYHQHHHPQQHFDCSIFILEEEEDEEEEEHPEFHTPNSSLNNHRFLHPSSSSSSGSGASPLLFFTPRSSFNQLFHHHPSASADGSSPSSAPLLNPPNLHPHPSTISRLSPSRSTSALPSAPSKDNNMNSLSRNSSSGSLSSSVPLMMTRPPPRMSFGGSTPNGMGHHPYFPLQQKQQIGKRSFAGMGIRESGNADSGELITINAQQPHQTNNIGRSPLFTAALNNSANEYFHQHNPQPLFTLYNSRPTVNYNNPPMPQHNTVASIAGGSQAGDSITVMGDNSTVSPPLAPSRTNIVVKNNKAPSGGFSEHQLEPLQKHRGELSIHEKYRYDLSRAQLKASSRTSALLSGFAMVALVELQYQETTPKPLLILLAVVTTLLVSVHLLALMMSTCLLPYIEANGCTQDSPHIKLRFYIELSWLFSTCIGLLLFLLEIGVIFFVKFNSINYNLAAYITTGMLVPVVIVFIIISYLIHRNRFTHSIERVSDKVTDLQKFLYESELNLAPPKKSQSVQRNMMNAGLQGITVIRNVKS